MTLTLTDLAMVVLAIQLVVMVDKLGAWVLHRLTGRCWICRRRWIGEEFDRELERERAEKGEGGDG